MERDVEKGFEVQNCFSVCWSVQSAADSRFDCWWLGLNFYEFMWDQFKWYRWIGRFFKGRGVETCFVCTYHSSMVNEFVTYIEVRSIFWFWIQISNFIRSVIIHLRVGRCFCLHKMFAWSLKFVLFSLQCHSIMWSCSSWIIKRMLSIQFEFISLCFEPTDPCFQSIIFARWVLSVYVLMFSFVV